VYRLPPKFYGAAPVVVALLVLLSAPGLAASHTVRTLSAARTAAPAGPFEPTRATPLAEPSSHPLSWSSVAEPWAPRANYAASMTFDVADGYTLLFGGCVPGGYLGLGCTAINQTAALRAGYWTPVNSTVLPPARYEASMAYDPVDGYVLLFGGQGSGIFGLNDTWSYSGGQWENRTTAVAPPRLSGLGGPAGLVYDPAIDAMLYYGGNCNATWTYVGGSWNHVNMSGQVCPNVPSVQMAYDPEGGYVLLLGGSGLGEPVGTWEFANLTWENVTADVHGSPGSVVLGTMTYDALDGDVVLYGGASAEFFPTYYDATWLYANGSWTELPGSAGTAASSTYGAMAFDPNEGDVILLGGHGLLGNGDGTYALGEPLLQAAWSPVTVRTDANVTFGASLQYRGGTPPVSVAYSALPAGCSGGPLSGGSGNVTCRFSSAGNRSFNATLSDARAHDVSTGSVEVAVRPALSIVVQAPSTIAPGDAFHLRLVISGGWSGFYHVNYTGLPAPCPANNSTSLHRASVKL
jgi:hypothetical protein